MIKQIEMFSKRKWLLSGITLVGILSTAGVANAASLSYNSSLSTVTADGTLYDSTTTPSFGPPIPKFDPSVGTLQSVVVDLSGTVSGDAQYTNRSSRQPATINATLSATVDLNEETTGNLLGEAIPSSPQTISVPANGSGTRTFPSASQSVTNTYTDGSTLSLFTGSPGSNVSLSLTPNSSSSFTGTGNFTIGFDTFASGAATVTYNYSPAVTAVPEPSNMLAVGLVGGLGVFTTVRKLQKRQAQIA